MNVISILTSQHPLKRGFYDFYPLVKWKRILNKEYNLSIIYFRNHNDKHIFINETLIIDYRYFKQFIDKGVYPNQNFIIEFILKAKKNGNRVILFDTGDSTGSRCFNLTPYVDIHLKKQLLKNKEEYLVNRGDKSVMCWISDPYTPSNIPYKELSPDNIHKLRLAWNIGMCDYREFLFSEYYPIGTNSLFNSFYKEPKFIVPNKAKEYLLVYRGTINNDTRYSFQRNYILQNFRNNEKIIVGNVIKKNKYIKELKKSKIIISPFGWGEICYRDFECFIYGGLLLKPNVEHLETFPNFFIRDKTYIPLEWDMSNLEDEIMKINDNFKDYIEIATYAQNNYRKYINDCDGFIKHFINVIKGN